MKAIMSLESGYKAIIDFLTPPARPRTAVLGCIT